MAADTGSARQTQDTSSAVRPTKRARIVLGLHPLCAFGLMVIGAIGYVGMSGHRDTAPWLHSQLRLIAFGLPAGFTWGAFALDGRLRSIQPVWRRLALVAGALVVLVLLAAAAILALLLIKG